MNSKSHRALKIGLVYETFGTYASRPDGPIDANVEYEPESTVEVLEAAIRGLGHRPVRVGSPEVLWARGLRGEAADRLDVVLNIAEGHGSRIVRPGPLCCSRWRGFPFSGPMP